MGSPVYPIVANLYMEEFEQKALATALVKPALWCRDVDDTFVVLQENELNNFTEHINKRDPNTKFTS
jgi:hypothetical protein